MSSHSLLRACRGASRLLLLKSKIGLVPTKLSNEVIQRMLPVSPAVSLHVHRGPYTPEGKRHHGHLMFQLMEASTHWITERAVTVAMLGILPTALFYQGFPMDYLVAFSAALHAHWGMHGVLTDYVTKFVPKIHIVLYIVSTLTFAGLFYFNYNDVGVCKAVQMLWSL